MKTKTYKSEKATVIINGFIDIESLKKSCEVYLKKIQEDERRKK